MEFSLTALAGAVEPGAPNAYGAIGFLLNLAVILCVAAVTTVLFQKLKQPVVLGYILAGLIVGPYVPVPVSADLSLAHTLSEVGVILLMFSLGLEFSLRKLLRVGSTAAIVAVIQCSLMIWLGYVTGRAFGWTVTEGLFTGALIAISSTTIIVKAFADQKVTGRITQIVFGVLIIEDLIAILLLAILTGIASGAGLSPGAIAVTFGRLAGFLLGLLVVGLLVVPRLIRFVVSLRRKETTLVASVGICFACALLAHRFGYSVALGAFLAGALVAESGEGRKIEHLIEPVRDMFAAIFFVSVGMIIEPRIIAQHWAAVLVLTAAVVIGKVVSVSLAAFIAGNGVRTSVQAGMSLAQIGEFSFIIAAVGRSLGAVGEFLYPVAVAVSAVTTLLTPFLIRISGQAGSYVAGRLPRPLQTYASLYESWVERMRSSAPAHPTTWSRIRRLGILLAVDVGAIALIIIGASLGMNRFVSMGERFELAPAWSRLGVVVGAVLISAPFLFGAVRVTQRLGMLLAREALPPGGGVDLATAPRRALLVTIQLAILLLAGTPLVAITQPLLPSIPLALVVGILLAVLAVAFWRRANDLEGHARAGAEVVLEALSQQTRSDAGESSDGLAAVRKLVPGLGEPKAVRVPPTASAAGKSLRELDVRGQTGATVLCIERPGKDAILPSADETIRPGDVVVLAGSEDAVSNATTLLTHSEGTRAGDPGVVSGVGSV